MKKIIDYILKMRVFIIILFLGLTLLAGIEAVQTKINPDIGSYLDSQSMSRQTIVELQENFSINGDILIGIGEKNLTADNLNQITTTISEIAQLDNISELDWIGSDLNRSLFLKYNDTMTGVIDLLLLAPNDWNISIEKNQALQQMISRYYQTDSEGHGCFLIYISLETSNTSSQSYSLIDEIDSILKTNYDDFYIGGTASKSKTMLSSALLDLPKFLTTAVVIIFLILLLCTKSFLEPIIFLFTIGVAIILNMGSNFFLGEISTVTFSAAAILQLALAMDYSIFLMHSYYEERSINNDKFNSMKKALLKTNRSIAASALTTIGGFVALFAMKFRLGFDMGFVLAKGVLFSLIVVMVFQPCIILVFDKLFAKTSHRYLNFHFKGLSKGIRKTRLWGALIAIILIVPAFIYQSKIEYYYLDSRINQDATGAEEVVNTMGSQLVIIVDDADQPTKQMQTLGQIFQLNDGVESEIVSIIGYYPILNQIETIVDMTHPAYAQFQAMNLAVLLQDKFMSDNKTYYIIQMSGTSESSSAINLNQEIGQILDTNFNQYFMGGNSQAVLDLDATTENDFLMVSIISAIIILLILIFTYQSLITPLLLLFVIELGIFINLSITHFIGKPINFMSYLIISAIQLGATIDYAILLTSRYRENYDIQYAIQSSSMSIIVSIAILLSSCMSVYFVASDPIIKEITFLIARGSVISGILVLVLLPRLLVFIHKKKTNPTTL